MTVKQQLIEWNDERAEYLKTRKAEGYSASIIAAELHTSKGSIMSKARKMNLGAWKSTHTAYKVAEEETPEEDSGDSRVKGVMERARAAKDKRERDRALFLASSRKANGRVQLSKSDLRLMLAEAVRNTRAHA